MIIDSLIFAVSLAAVMQGAALATRASIKIGDSFRLSRYVVGCVVVALIAILPETIVSISAALEGAPEMGLGTLLGSNVADLTLIFALLVLVSGRPMRVESQVVKSTKVYPLFLLLPLVLGLDGRYSRIDALALILVGSLFYYLVFRRGAGLPRAESRGSKGWAVLLMAGSIALLLVGAHFTVTSALALTTGLGINRILIGLLVISLGTTLPEFFYSLKAMRAQEDDMAIGDILGAVLADATIVIGLLALIRPFDFPVRIIYLTGAFMLAASLVLIRFLRTGRHLTRKEAVGLFAFWLFYVVMEIVLGG